MGSTGRRARRHIALRYMTGFRCVGAACQDSCCGHWGISVDQGHFVKIRRLMSKTPQERQEFAGAFVLQPKEERTSDSHAVVRLRDDHSCPMLDEDRLCSLQRRYGAGALPDACATYPRFLSLVGAHAELTGALSCPEVVRLALLSDDATDIVEIDEAELGPLVVQQSTRSGAHRGRHLDEIRGTMYQLASRTAYPIPSRLFFMASLAHDTDALLCKPGRRIDRAALEAALDHMEEEPLLEGLHRQVEARLLEPPLEAPLVLQIIAGLVSERVRQSSWPAFHRVAGVVLASYAADPQGGVCDLGAGKSQITPLLLWSAFMVRRQALERAFGARLEMYFRNYCKHFWIKEWYVNSTSLRVHVQGLLVRMALLRFLLFSHPEAQAAAARPDAAAGAADADAVAVLDGVAVDVFYAVSRLFEHSSNFLDGIGRVLERRLPDVTHSIELLRL